VIVALDADTQFPRNDSHVARRFEDPQIGAVPATPRWQPDKSRDALAALEYIIREHGSTRVCQLELHYVVPGFSRRWRRELIEECGGFSNESWRGSGFDSTHTQARLPYRYEEGQSVGRSAAQL